MVARAGADGPDTGLQQDERQYRLEHGSSKFDRDDKQDDLNSRTSHHGYQEAAETTFKSNMQLALATGDVRRAHNSEPMEFDEDIEQREQEDEEELAQRLGEGEGQKRQQKAAFHRAPTTRYTLHNTPTRGDAVRSHQYHAHWAN